MHVGWVSHAVANASACQSHWTNRDPYYQACNENCNAWEHDRPNAMQCNANWGTNVTTEHSLSNANVALTNAQWFTLFTHMLI
jgi:hypothetical protein